MRDTKRMLKRRIELQQDIISTLEETVVIMGDVNKVKDLTLQALVGAFGSKVPPEEIEKALSGGDTERGPGQYL